MDGWIIGCGHGVDEFVCVLCFEDSKRQNWRRPLVDGFTKAGCSKISASSSFLSLPLSHHVRPSSLQPKHPANGSRTKTLMPPPHLPNLTSLYSTSQLFSLSLSLSLFSLNSIDSFTPVTQETFWFHILLHAIN